MGGTLKSGQLVTKPFSFLPLTQLDNIPGPLAMQYSQVIKYQPLACEWKWCALLIRTPMHTPQTSSSDGRG